MVTGPSFAVLGSAGGLGADDAVGFEGAGAVVTGAGALEDAVEGDGELEVAGGDDEAPDGGDVGTGAVADVDDEPDGPVTAGVLLVAAGLVDVCVDDGDAAAGPCGDAD